MSDIRERIRRLLALSESSNVHEAAAAAAKAQELMTKHQIDQAEVAELAGEDDEPLEDEELQVFGSKVVTWRECLAAALATANGCDLYHRISRQGGRRRASSRIVGPVGAVAAVRYMLAYLEREVDRLCQKEAGDWGRGALPRSWYRNFRFGAAYAIGRRLHAAAKEVRAAAAPGCALVRVDRDAERVAAAMAEKGLKASRKPSVTDTSAFAEGMKAGRTVVLTSGPALPSAPAAALRDEP